MSDISLTSQLRARGLNDDDLARLRRRGDLVRVRRGAYALPSKLEPVDTWDAEDRHRLLIAATAPQLTSGAVISHASAAVLHGLPTWPEALNRVHVSRSRNYGGKKRTVVAVHCAPFLPTEVIEIDGIPTTTLARTVVDLARSRPFEEAVAAGDRALTLRLAPATLISVMRRMERWPNVRQARRVVAFSTPGVRAPANRSAGYGSPTRGCQRHSCSDRSPTDTGDRSAESTSVGMSSERSASSTERSSTAAYSNLVRPART